LFESEEAAWKNYLHRRLELGMAVSETNWKAELIKEAEKVAAVWHAANAAL
jgi:hypothetical protein